jgi:glycosyltransferase involved in cell wall biosynthesis
MLKVYHFIMDHRVGGPHVYARTISDALEAKVKSIFVTSGNGEVTDIALFNLRHIFRALYPLEVVLNILKLIWLFRNKGSRNLCVFDIHGAANIAPICASRLLGIPCVWHFHETLAGFKGIAKLGKICISSRKGKYVAVANKAVEVFGLNDAVVIPGSIDPNYWHASAAKPRRHGLGQPFQLMAVGNLNPLKGQDSLLDALAGLEQPWELSVVGAELSTYREYAAKLHEKSLSLSTRGEVRFLGWRPPEQIRDLLASTDVFVLSSRSEACPIALLEAMSMGCVCIATNVGDVSKIIHDPQLGFVVASDSVRALRVAIEQVGNMTAMERGEMGKRARRETVIRYSHEKMAERHMGLYLSLTKGQAGG